MVGVPTRNGRLSESQKNISVVIMSDLKWQHARVNTAFPSQSGRSSLSIDLSLDVVRDLLRPLITNLPREAGLSSPFLNCFLRSEVRYPWATKTLISLMSWVMRNAALPHCFASKQ
jgi:hypothetical protein